MSPSTPRPVSQTAGVGAAANPQCDATKCDPLPLTVTSSSGASTLVGQVGSPVNWSFQAETNPPTTVRQIMLIVLDIPTGLSKQGTGASGVLSGSLGSPSDGTIRVLARDVSYCKFKNPANAAQCEGEGQITGDEANVKSFQYSIQQLANGQQPGTPGGVQPPKPNPLICFLGAVPGVITGNIIGGLFSALPCLLR